MSTLAKKTCKACEGSVAKLDDAHAYELLKAIPNWQISSGELTRTFSFHDYFEVLAFVNATAWISHRENHHPDMEVSYNKVTMRYSTHSVSGLTENDFICAAKINDLIDQAPEL